MVEERLRTLDESIERPNERVEPLAAGEARPVVYYEGSRIYFRPLELEDEPHLRRWINDPRVWRTLGHYLPKNAQAERAWIESLYKSETDVVFGVALKENDALVGTTGLHRVNPVSRSAVFGICIGDVSQHNMGFGTEATRLCVQYGFEVLNLNRIELEVLANNFRGIRTYQKAGFQPEGCRRQAMYRNGRYEDVYVFAILRAEYDASMREPDGW